MKRKSLLVVALLLALSVTMAAMAYGSSMVNTSAQLTISAPDNSLLAFAPGTGVGTKDMTADVVDNKLAINFGKGLNGQFGLQPDSTYAWHNLFTITNNSADTVVVKMHQHPYKAIFTSGNGVAGVFIAKYAPWNPGDLVRRQNGGSVLFEEYGTTNEGVELAPGQTAYIAASIAVAPDAGLKTLAGCRLYFQTLAK